MAEDSRDVLMTIVLGGNAIPAECQAIVDPTAKDTLAGGFVPGTKSNGYCGNYFAVENFSFDVGLMADTVVREPSPHEKAKADEEAKKEMFLQVQEMVKSAGTAGDGKLGISTSQSSSQFARFMNGGRSALRGRSYSANLEPVSLTKNMDASSLTLLKACLESTTLDSAVLIKRRAVGATRLRTYLRIEFTNLLITDFNWDEDEVVKETLKFVCRKAQVQYAVESNDGTLQKPGQTRTWSVLNLAASS